jgi:hypothetical protein
MRKGAGTLSDLQRRMDCPLRAVSHPATRRVVEIRQTEFEGRRYEVEFWTYGDDPGVYDTYYRLRKDGSRGLQIYRTHVVACKIRQTLKEAR